MSKLMFEGDEYTLSELITLRRLSKKYKIGEVLDTETGETIDIKDIDKLKSIYIDELISQNEKTKFLSNKDKKNMLSHYEKKYKENTITKEELMELIKFKREDYLEITYDNFIFFNIEKPKPENLSVIDYGRFILLLDLMRYTNKVQHSSNGKKIKEEELVDKLELKTKKSLQNLFSKLSNLGMIAKTGSGDKKFIHINPAYAKRRMKIDKTIYDFFKNDLKEFLNEYEIKYFEMDDDKDYTSPTLQII